MALLDAISSGEDNTWTVVTEAHHKQDFLSSRLTLHGQLEYLLGDTILRCIH